VLRLDKAYLIPLGCRPVLLTGAGVPDTIMPVVLRCREFRGGLEMCGLIMFWFKAEVGGCLGSSVSF